MAQIFFICSILCMAEREAKLRKLDDFRRKVPTASQSALSKILKEIERDGAPEFYQTEHMREARKLVLGEEIPPFGKIISKMNLPKVGGGSFEAHFVQPLAWLRFIYDTCPSIREMIQRSYRAKPSSDENPWNVILYSDEVTPENPLKPDLTKKLQAIYWSFQEFGPAVLCQENAWFVLLVFRSMNCKDVEGGLARLVGEGLKQFFVGPYSLRDVGILLYSQADDEAIRVWAQLGIIVQDGGAHKEVWQMKGDASLRMCLTCNALKFDTDLRDYTDGGKPMSCSRAADFIWFTDEEVIDKADRLKQCYESNLKPEAKHVHSQVIGFTYCIYMLLLDPALRGIVKPVSQFMHDWMHGLFSGGVFNICLHCVFEQRETEGVQPYKLLDGFYETWNFPKRLASFKDNDAFNERRRKGNRDAGKFRCSASEGMTMFPIIAYWLVTFCMPMGKAVKACGAFLKFCTLASCFMMVHMGTITANRLNEAVESFLDAFIDAFGIEPMISKFQWLLHYAKELAWHKMLYACFVHERKHKLIRRFAVPHKNVGTSFELGILEEASCQQLYDLKHNSRFTFEAGLLEPKRACGKKRATALLQALDLTAGDVDKVYVGETSRVNAFEVCSKGWGGFAKYGNEWRRSFIGQVLSTETIFPKQ